jgi:hypothetical protein
VRRHDIDWTLQELDRQHGRTVKERFDMWCDEHPMVIWGAAILFGLGLGVWAGL